MRFVGAIARGRAVRVGAGIVGLIVAACSGLSGCGNSDSLPVLAVHNVKGKVLLASGKPLSGGWIYFVPKAGHLPVTPSGAIGPDGAFSLVTGGSGEGAPPGDYKVRLRRQRPVKRTGNPFFPPDTTMRTARAC
jgi:hypothetical protein